MSIQRYLSEACEADLDKYGDTFRGAGYTKSKNDADRCYQVMLDLVRSSEDPVSLLDVGCGLAHFYEYMQTKRVKNVDYSGLDLSDKYLAVAQAKHPDVSFRKLDIRAEPELIGDYDYIVMNGLFNYKGENTQDEMMAYWSDMIEVAFTHCNKGIAFNVMSKLVEWERDDLFHLSFDSLTNYVAKNLSRHFVIRHDYGMYEYTTYVYKENC